MNLLARMFGEGTATFPKLLPFWRHRPRGMTSRNGKPKPVLGRGDHPQPASRYMTMMVGASSATFSRWESPELVSRSFHSAKRLVDTKAYFVKSLLLGSTSQLDAFWQQHVLGVPLKPAAWFHLVSQLDTLRCPMGFDPSKVDKFCKRGGSVRSVELCREERKKRPKCLFLARSGRKYHAYGLDAMLLLGTCSSAKQRGTDAWVKVDEADLLKTLHELVDRGLCVGVMEERSLGGSETHDKHLFLTQIVSPAFPNYYFSKANPGRFEHKMPRPYVCVQKHPKGFTLVEIQVEERTVRVLENLQAEAVAARLVACNAAAPPTWYVSSEEEALSGHETDEVQDSLHFSFAAKAKAICPSFVVKPWRLLHSCGDGTPSDQTAHYFLRTVLAEGNFYHYKWEEDLRCEDFTIIVDASASQSGPRTEPLDLHTAEQLGFLSTGKDNCDTNADTRDRCSSTAGPCILPHALTAEASVSCRRLFTRWLMSPPPPHVAEAMAHLVQCFQRRHSPEEDRIHMDGSPQQVCASLWAQESDSFQFQEILRALKCIGLLLSSDSVTSRALMTVVEYETGLSCDGIRERLMEAAKTIQVATSFFESKRSEVSETKADESCVPPPGEELPDSSNECATISPVQLGQKLRDDHMDVVKQAMHGLLILATAQSHAIRTQELGWSRVTVTDPVGNADKIHFIDLRPYWIDRDEAVPNTVCMRGMWALTGGIGSGKWTFVRSVASAAVLSVSGFCAPVAAQSRLVRFDRLIVNNGRTPCESSFAGFRAAQLLPLLSERGGNSFVFVQGCAGGRSSEPYPLIYYRQGQYVFAADGGAMISGAILETMIANGVSGIFSDPLPEFVDLPLEGKEKLVMKKKAIRNEGCSVNHTIQDGICRARVPFGFMQHDKTRFESLEWKDVETGRHDAGSRWPYDGVFEMGNSPAMAKLAGFPPHLCDRAIRLGWNWVKLPSPTHNIDPTLQKVLDFASGMIGCSAEFVRPFQLPPRYLRGKHCLLILETAACSLTPGAPRIVHEVRETVFFLQQKLWKHDQKECILGAHVFLVADSSRSNHFKASLVRYSQLVGLPLNAS